MKFSTIISAGGGVVGLSEDGELYFGHWVAARADGLAVPFFQWRKIPPPPEKILTFELKPEIPKLELAKLAKQADKKK